MINFITFFRFYENLMMALTKNATAFTFNSGYNGPLATDGPLGQQTMYHEFCQLCQESQKNSRQDTMRKVFNLESQCLRKPKETFVYLSSFEVFSYFWESCISNKSVSDKMNESWLDVFKTEKKQNLLKMSPIKNHRTRCR